MNAMAPHFWRQSKVKFFKKDLFFVTTPWWLRKLYPGCIWDFKSSEKTIYISFDDGPHPTITPFVLKVLEQYNAKATFFCIGDNVKKHPEVYQQVIDAGHAVGNHTMHHVNGWKSADKDYLNDISQANEYINTNIFRPPYGRVTQRQIKLLSTGLPHFSVIMWSVLAGDWVNTITPQKCFEHIKNNVYPGCIVVFHDSEKANERMRYALPRVLEHFSKQGYQFKKINSSL
jgi:peptidoglycan-N-acetylglucosamine deacetylase